MSDRIKNAAGAPAKMNPTASDAKAATSMGTLDYNTKTKVKTWAEAIYSMMGVGRQNAVYVYGRDAYDIDVRAFKRLVATKRKEGIPIIAGRDGHYWIADMTDPRDRAAVEHQIYSLLHRAHEIEAAAYAMADACLPGCRP